MQLNFFRKFAKPFPAKVALSACIATFITLVTLNLNLYRVEAFLYDLRIRLKGEELAHPQISLLALDESDGDLAETSHSIKGLANLLDKLANAKPRAIVFLNKFEQSDIETNPISAAKFVTLARKAQASGVQFFLGTDLDQRGEMLPPDPLVELPHAPSVLHKDGILFGEDKVTRRALLTILDEPSLHVLLAFPQLSKKEVVERVTKLHGAYYFRPGEAWHMMIRYPFSTDQKDNLFPRYNYSELANKEDLSFFHDKIVLIDSVRKNNLNDFGFTPYSRITYTHPKLMIHAAILDSLMKDSGIRIGSSKLDILLTLVLSFTLTLITISLSPSRGVFALVFFSFVLFAFSLIVFKFGYWLRLVHPLVAMFFTYYLIVPYRAIFEYKKRWEVQEKHDLLVQVEEIKGNFLSLMSHDLKTPVARIQGLSEMVLRQGGLKPEQEDEIRQILNTTENLDKFISKILNLTKVESADIKLNKKSKDINKIIEQCVQKLQFHAQAKDIALKLDLEPLFPISLDAALMIQVFTNIIDNAIKYSPAGTSVEISTREIGSQVQVTVKDNGPGMDEEEKSQLFTKFFRGKSHPGDQTKGSGLGLYLSKYFIELHNGSILVETHKGSGTMFSIRLPLAG